MSLSQPPGSRAAASPATLNSQAPNPQLASPFLSLLPFEIRQQIYKEVIASFGWGKQLHILLDRGQEPIERSGKQKELVPQLTYIPCTLLPIGQIPSSNDRYSYSPSWPTQHERCQGWKSTGQAPPVLQGTYLNVFLSCRRIHDEAIGLLYNEHSFALNTLRTMHRFLTSVPAQHLNLIQNLHVIMTIPDSYLNNAVPLEEMNLTVRLKAHTVEIEWLRSCLALTKMTGMNKLEIDLWNETYDEVIEEELLKGLCNVRVLGGGNFVVRLPWKEGNPVPKVERMAVGGFMLERRPFGVEPATNRLHYNPSPIRWYEVVLGILCCPCIILVCVGSGVKTLVKRKLRRRS